MLKRLVGYKLERKSISQKGNFIYKIGRFVFEKNKLCSNNSISQGADGFISFQAIKIVSMFVIFQIIACLHMKFGNVEAADKLQIRKKKYLTKRHLHREHG